MKWWTVIWLQQREYSLHFCSYLVHFIIDESWSCIVIDCQMVATTRILPSFLFLSWPFYHAQLYCYIPVLSVFVLIQLLEGVHILRWLHEEYNPKTFTKTCTLYVHRYKRQKICYILLSWALLNHPMVLRISFVKINLPWRTVCKVAVPSTQLHWKSLQMKK
jgi:hypothetical protein